MNIIIIISIIVIIAIIYIALHRSNKMDSFTEGFNPWIDYSRAYPGTFSYKYGYGPYYRSFLTSYPGNIRYYPGYSDYWYIPAHEYLNNWINGSPTSEGGTMIVPDSCIIPPSTSEYCVNKRMQEDGNLDLAIYNCTVPATIPDNCPLQVDWKSPSTLGVDVAETIEQTNYINPTHGNPMSTWGNFTPYLPRIVQ
jgi:hypothetical protein